jgi:hypothetical protein
MVGKVISIDGQQKSLKINNDNSYSNMDTINLFLTHE